MGQAHKARMYAKKTFVLLLCVALLSTVMPTVARADDFSRHWARDYIVRAVDRGIFLYSPQGIYRPDASVTRAEFVAMVTRIEGFTSSTNLSRFPDVRPSDWFYDYFSSAVAEGIVVGTDRGLLNPHGHITRNEAATILARIHSLDTSRDNSAALGQMRDAHTIPRWARPYVGAVIHAGLMQGNRDRHFLGDDNLTRAEAAAILLRGDDMRPPEPGPGGPGPGDPGPGPGPNEPEGRRTAIVVDESGVQFNGEVVWHNPNNATSFLYATVVAGNRGAVFEAVWDTTEGEWVHTRVPQPQWLDIIVAVTQEDSIENAATVLPDVRINRNMPAFGTNLQRLDDTVRVLITVELAP